MKKKTSKEKLEFKQKLKEKRRERRELTKEAFAKNLLTTTKQLIWWFAINGTIWIYFSYILAFTDHPQIAESLSSNVCTVVIGSFVLYVVSKTIENVFKYNELGGKSNIDALKKEGINSDYEQDQPAGTDYDPADNFCTVSEDTEPTVDPSDLS